MGLFSLLENTSSPFERRRIIEKFLETQDLSKIIPAKSGLSKEDSVPSEDPPYRGDVITVLPFAKGGRYRIKEPIVEDGIVYVLGIVQPRSRLLVVDEKDDLYVLHREEIYFPIPSNHIFI
ncbi:MAG: hypothetical protein WC494_00380 [Candidatus Pacearchaeota archaeon]